MGWLDRLLGTRPQRTALPANAVVLPADLVAELTAGGRPLADAAIAALGEHLAARGVARVGQALPAAPAAPPPPAPPRPFWLGGGGDAAPAAGAPRGDVDAALRGRLARRRAEEEAGRDAPSSGGDPAPGAVERD